MQAEQISSCCCVAVEWIVSKAEFLRADFLRTMPENRSSQHSVTMGGRSTSSLQPLKQIALYPRMSMCVWVCWPLGRLCVWVRADMHVFTCFSYGDVSAHMLYKISKCHVSNRGSLVRLQSLIFTEWIIKIAIINIFSITDGSNDHICCACGE